MDSTGGCVKLKTVILIEIKQTSGRNTFIAESLCCTEFFVGLGVSGVIEIDYTEVWSVLHFFSVR